MDLFIAIAIFVASLFVLVKGADWLLESSEKIGLRAGLSHFIIGVTIVAFGTSLPELVSGLFAVLGSGATEATAQIVAGNAIGSNIANILLVIGFSAVIGKHLTVTKDLIDLDLPIFAITTATFYLIIVQDSFITLGESITLLVIYGIYLYYSITYKDREERENGNLAEKPLLSPKDFLMLIAGGFGLYIGAKFLIDSIIDISSMLELAPGVIAITAVAIGTSLPELIVSAKAAIRGNAEIALGNIFGSNIFNILVVIGIPGLFRGLPVDEKTADIGVITLMIATILFVISGISKRIHVQEGLLYLSLYFVFIIKLFDLF